MYIYIYIHIPYIQSDIKHIHIDCCLIPKSPINRPSIIEKNQVTDEAVKLFPAAAGPESNLAVMAHHDGICMDMFYRIKMVCQYILKLNSNVVVHHFMFLLHR